jgi:hypothetical protein
MQENYSSMPENINAAQKALWKLLRIVLSISKTIRARQRAFSRIRLLRKQVRFNSELITILFKE